MVLIIIKMKRNSRLNKDYFFFIKMKNTIKFKNNSKTIEILLFPLAGVEGLEPSQAVLETDVLPLTLYP